MQSLVCIKYTKSIIIVAQEERKWILIANNDTNSQLTTERGSKPRMISVNVKNVKATLMAYLIHVVHVDRMAAIFIDK